MMMLRSLIPVVAIWRSATALLVGDDSSCRSKCGNVLSSTTKDMIVCDDSAYSATSQGQVYQACVGCESTSTYMGQSTSDLQSMLYNMRFATNICLFDASNPCITTFACANIKDAIQYNNLSTSSSTYGYCDQWTDYNLDKCHSCLTSSGSNNYLSNFISVLDGACRLKLEPPATIPLQGRIFSNDAVNVTDPTPTATFTPPGVTGPLDSGAIAGIVVGGLVVLLAFTGCGIVIIGKRRRRAYLRHREQMTKEWPAANSGGAGGAGDMRETPLSQRPLRGWDNSPISGTTEGTYPPYPQYFSPYSSQYNSPVSAVEGPRNTAWPPEKAVQNIGVAISPDHDYHHNWAADSKGKERAASMAGQDEYELQEGVNSAGGYSTNSQIPQLHINSPPVLNHPGYGRHGNHSETNVI